VRWVWLGLLASTAVFAGRPLTVDDAGPVAPGQFEFETGVAFEHAGNCHHFDFPLGLTAGIVKTLEAGIGFGGQLEERLEDHGTGCTQSSIGDLALGLKWNPLAAERFWADHALALTAKLPTADSEKDLGSGVADFDLTYIATKSIGEQWNADFNLGYTWVGGDDDALHYGLALRWQAMKHVELVGEVFANTELAARQDTAMTAGVGARWEIMDGLVFDAAAGAGLRGESPDWTATIGFTWTFGFNNKK